MNFKIILCLALVAFDLSSHARAVRLWSDAELMEASDLVVVGQPIKVKDLDESNSLGWDKSIGWAQLTFRGVETTFKVSDVLKGMPATDQIVLHHYRFEKVHPPNGPNLIDFIPGDTNRYLLYLINDGTNRYAPAAGQIDPVVRPPPTKSLRVVVKPLKTKVRVKEPFKVTLRVENPTTTNQTMRVMNCSWYDEWQTSNTNITWISWGCGKNFAMSVEIPPGGAYTNQLEMLIPEPISKKTLSFRMGFTPIGSKKTFWSDEIRLTILPPDIWQHGAAIYRDRNHDGKIDWEVSGETWRHDGIDAYKADTNYDGFYDLKYGAGGIKGGIQWSTNIHERVSTVGKGFVPIEKPSWVDWWVE